MAPQKNVAIEPEPFARITDDDIPRLIAESRAEQRGR
jgi:hypothetical protein